MERMPATDLMKAVNRHVSEDGMTFLHPFDDMNLIQGHARLDTASHVLLSMIVTEGFHCSCGLEILEDVPDVDVVLVCCGGGGLVSGIAAAIKLSGKTDCRVIAVEPEAGEVTFCWATYLICICEIRFLHFRIPI